MLQMPSNIHGICCSLNHDLHYHSTRHNSKNACVTCFLGMNIVLKQFTTENFFHHMKVVTPSTACRHKKMLLSTPHDEFCISGHDIWGKEVQIDTYKRPKCI